LKVFIALLLSSSQMDSKTFHDSTSRRAVQKSIKTLEHSSRGRLLDESIVIGIRIEDEGSTKISKKRMIVIFVIDGIGD
jgi:hypothetical protein